MTVNRETSKEFSNEELPPIVFSNSPVNHGKSSTTASSSIKNLVTAYMSVKDAWNKRTDLVQKSINIKDVVVFSTICPSVEPLNPNSCSVKVFVGNLSSENFQLTRNGTYVECRGKVQVCQGFENNKMTSLSGTVTKCGYENGNYCLDIK